MSAAVALETLKLYQERDIFGHVRAVAPHFQARLRAFADHPLVGEARGVGLIGAIEFVAEKATKRQFDAKKQVGATAIGILQEHGVILRNVQDSICFCPPLVITTDEVHEMFDLVEKGLDAVEAWVRKENLRSA